MCLTKEKTIMRQPQRKPRYGFGYLENSVDKKEYAIEYAKRKKEEDRVSALRDEKLENTLTYTNFTMQDPKYEIRCYYRTYEDPNKTYFVYENLTSYEYFKVEPGTKRNIKIICQHLKGTKTTIVTVEIKSISQAPRGRGGYRFKCSTNWQIIKVISNHPPNTFMREKGTTRVFDDGYGPLYE